MAPVTEHLSTKKKKKKKERKEVWHGIVYL
jgi:hypothetical protein